MTVGVHRLSRTAFDSVAIGRPDPEAVRTLRFGQHSRHLLLLRLVLDAARRNGCGALVDDAVEVLGAVQASAPREYETVIRYPYVGAWASQALRSTGDREAFASHVRYLANVAVAAAVRAGITTDLPVQIRHGVAHLPTVGSAVGLADSRVRGTGCAPEDRRRDHAGWLAVREIVDGDGTVLFDDLDPYRAPSGMTAAGRADDVEFQRWSGLVRAGRQVLAGRARSDGPVLEAITPLPGSAGRQGMSATSRAAFGSIVLTMPEDATAYAVTEVHELRHAVLNALLDLVPLVDPAHDGRYYAPWRSDPRPLLGLLHGTYAFLGIAGFWSDGPIGGARARFELARTSAQVFRALNTLAESSGLLDAGLRFVDRMRAGFAPEPAEWYEARLARIAVEDHRCAWRLRNARPDEGAAERAADAWLAGGHRSPQAAPAELIASSETFTVGARLSLLSWAAENPSGLAELRAGALPERWADLTVADLDLAEGDLATAAEGYLARIDKDAGDIESWSGLAVCRAGSARDDWPGVWSQRPEWIRAVYLELCARGARPPLDALAAWLDR
jgi:HEXXH motif-containing protein